jgi:putative MATE family efflux protein
VTAGPASVADPAADAAPPEPPPTFWASVREALRGSEHDYSRGPIGRAVLLLAVPMVLEMALESVFAVTDIFFVSHLGPDATATVALTESLLVLVYAFAMGVGIAATALVARRTGEHDPEGAAQAAGQAVLIATGSALVLGAIGAALAPRLLALMGASPSVLRVGTGYARVMLGGEASIILLFVVNAIFRGAGDAVTAMRTLWVANGINIVLGPLLIFGPGPLPALGVTGAGVATTIGRGTGAALAMWQLMRARPAGAPAARVRVAPRHLRPDRTSMTALARLAWAAGLQQVVGSANWIVLVRIVAVFGSAALAGYSIAIRIVIFALLPAWGLSNAAATLVGQSLGAGDPARAEQAVWLTARYNAVFLSAVGALFVVAAGPLVGAFTPDATVAAGGARALRIVASGFLFYAYGMVLTAAFNGAGDTRTPTWLNLFAFWLFELPLAWVLAVPLGWGPTGAMVAVALAFSALAAASAVLFRRGRWKTRAV